MELRDRLEPDRRLRRWLDRHERAAIGAWLSFCAALLAVLGLWGVAANGAEHAVDSLDSGWIGELDRAAELVRRRELEPAVALLERLDRECPAVFVKHRHDRERERLLGLLGGAYADLDRRRLARETLHRLVVFDPRNYDNHFRLAEVERRFGDGPAATESYARVLAIHPSHLPSVRAVIEIAQEEDAHAEAIAAFERYLDAWLLARVRVACGERSLELDVLVDGREHEVEGALELPPGWSGEVCVETRGYSARIVALELVAPAIAGVSGRSARIAAFPEAVEIAAAGSGSRACSAAAAPGGSSRIRMRLALYKALPADLWARVGASYRHELADEAFARARERARTGGCLEAGSVFVE